MAVTGEPYRKPTLRKGGCAPLRLGGILALRLGRRSRAALAEFPDWYAKFPRLVGEIVLDAGAWKHHDPDRQNLQHSVVPFEGRRFGVLGPIGLERDLCHLAIVGPFGGDELGAFGDPPCSSTMSGCLA